MSKRFSLFLLVSIVLLATFAQPFVAHAQWGDDRSDIGDDEMELIRPSTAKRVVLSPEEKAEANIAFLKDALLFLAGLWIIGVILQLFGFESSPPGGRTRHYEPRSRDYM